MTEVRQDGVNSINWVRSNADEGIPDDDREPVFRFSVNEAASTWLRGLDREINFVSIFGRARSGKSTFMNFLNGDEEVFGVSDGQVSYTNGSNLSKNVRTLEDFHGVEEAAYGGKMHVALIDNEGSGQKPKIYDTMLLLPSLVISKVTIYMIPGEPQPQALLEELLFMSDVRERLRMPDSRLGHLHLLIRYPRRIPNGDVRAFIFDSEGESADEEPLQGWRERNKMRTMLLNAFKTITVWPTSDRWLSNYDKEGRLLLEDFNETYNKFFASFKDKVAEQCKEGRKIASMETLDTATSAALMEDLVEKLNANNDEAFPLSFFDQVQQGRVAELKEVGLSELQKYVFNTKAEWKTGSLPPAPDCAAAFDAKSGEVKEALEKRVASFKKALQVAALSDYDNCSERLKASLLLYLKGEQAKQLHPDLIAYLDGAGVGFLKEACVENGITTKEVFMNVRKDEETLGKLLEDRNASQQKTIKDVVFKSKDFDEKTAKLKQQKEYFQSLITEAKALETAMQAVTTAKMTDQDAKLKAGIADLRARIGRELSLNLPDPGIVTADLKSSLRTIQTDLDSFCTNMVKQEMVSDADLVQYYELNKGQLYKAHGVIQTKDVLFQFGNASIIPVHQAESLRYSTKSLSAMETKQNIVTSGGFSFGTQSNVSGAAFVGEGVGAFSVSAGMTMSQQEDEARMRASGQTTAVLHSLQTDYIPLGTLSLDKSDIKFTAKAKAYLATIQEDFEANKNTKARDAALWGFVETYGSHVCRRVSLGGHYTEASTATFQAGVEKSEQEKIVAQAFDANFSAGGFALGGTGLVAGGNATNFKNQSFYGEQSRGTFSNEKATVTFTRKILGGDTLASKALWKQSLVCNSAYHVVDRDASRIEGVWNFLPEEYKKLAQPMKMIYLNKALNPTPAKPLDDEDRLIQIIKDAHYTALESRLVEEAKKRVRAHGNWTALQNERIAVLVKKDLHRYIVNLDWDTERALQSLVADVVRTLADEAYAKRMATEVVFLHVMVKTNTKNRQQDAQRVKITDIWTDPAKGGGMKYRSRSWPKNVTTEFRDVKWGWFSRHSDGFSFSNNLNQNSGGPEACWGTIVYKATRRALLEADFPEAEVDAGVKANLEENKAMMYLYYDKRD